MWFSRGAEELSLYSFEGYSNSQRSLLEKWKPNLFRAPCLIVLENVDNYLGDTTVASICSLFHLK